VLVSLTSVPARSASDAAPPVIAVEVLLTVAPHLSADARAGLVREATALWRDAGVRLEWRPPLDHPPARRLRLRVLVVERDARVMPGTPIPVGELLRTGEGDALAFVSIAQAARVVVLAAPPAQREPGSLSDRRLGLVLGRAVAHEIGHYVLGGRAHATVGLMRATFDPREFAGLDSAGFSLDPGGAARLRAHGDQATH
jgi:hypothetical protein